MSKGQGPLQTGLLVGMASEQGLYGTGGYAGWTVTNNRDLTAVMKTSSQH